VEWVTAENVQCVSKSDSNGSITSAIKLAIKLTIKLKLKLQLQQAAFCCSYNKNANEGCNSCALPPARLTPSPAKIPRLSIVMGAGSEGDTVS